MAKDKNLSIQGDSSDKDDVPLVKTPKPTASATAAAKKRNASPEAENLPVKKIKKKSASDAHTSTKKITAMELPALKPTAEVVAKQVRLDKGMVFDAAVVSLLVDSDTHPLYEHHYTQAISTCSVGKKDPEKLDGVFDAMQTKAVELGFSDDNVNNAIAHVRGCYLKQQVYPIAAQVNNPVELLALLQGVISKVDGNDVAELDDAEKLRALCKKFRIKIKRARTKLSSNDESDEVEEAGAANETEVQAEETVEVKNEPVEEEQHQTEPPRTQKPTTFDEKVNNAIKCLLICKKSNELTSLAQRARAEQLKMVFQGPSDLFVMYVMQPVRAEEDAAGHIVNYDSLYQKAVDHWRDLPGTQRSQWNERVQKLQSGNLAMLYNFKNDDGVVKAVKEIKKLINPPPGRRTRAQLPAFGESTRGNHGYGPPGWQATVSPRPSPNPLSQMYGPGQHPPTSPTSNMGGGTRVENKQSGFGAARGYFPTPQTTSGSYPAPNSYGGAWG